MTAAIKITTAKFTIFFIFLFNIVLNLIKDGRFYHKFSKIKFFVFWNKYIKKNKIIFMKHIRKFRLFNRINEELSPELQKRAYDKMVQISKDPQALDSLIKSNMAKKIQAMVSPAVKQLLDKLQEMVSSTMEDAKDKFIHPGYSTLSQSNLRNIKVVELVDTGLEEGVVVFLIKDRTFGEVLMSISITKDKYQKSSFNEELAKMSKYSPSANTAEDNYMIESLLMSSKAFVRTLKQLIVQVQQDEIPVEGEVPAEPKSVTQEGSLEFVHFPLTGTEIDRQQINRVHSYMRESKRYRKF
jgi:hypothetical protein